MIPTTPPGGLLRTAELAGRRPVGFAIEADDAARRAIAAALDLVSLERLRFAGQVCPEGRSELRLAGRIVATGAQRCVVTLAPVPLAIDAAVERHYVAGLAMPEGGEVEMPADDRVEPMPAVIDLGAVMAEALSLALPDYPRAPGAELGAAAFGPPGVAPLADDALRPLAALRSLRPGADGDGGSGSG